MIYLVPMGGHGTRFRDAGYRLNKASIPTIDRHSGLSLPMVVCAMKDLPGIYSSDAKIICVDRDFHASNGTEDMIRAHFPSTRFIHDHVLLDQAFGCFLAREFLQTDEELIIGACDNGMDVDLHAFNDLRSKSDVIMFSHSGDENIARNPNAHSWAKLSKDGCEIREISVKQPISKNYMFDHATTGMFWFRRASVFLSHLEKMIWKQDTIDGKFYVDKVLQHCIQSGLTVRHFDVRYHCWGTPWDYENYQNTLTYWFQHTKKVGHFVG